MHAVLVFLAADIIQLPFFKLHNKPRQKSATKAPTTNSSLGNAHTDATTHRVAAVDEVVALRGEAAQHAVLLLRWRGPARPTPIARCGPAERQPLEHTDTNIASDASHQTENSTERIIVTRTSRRRCSRPPSSAGSRCPAPGHFRKRDERIKEVLKEVGGDDRVRWGDVRIWGGERTWRQRR